MENQIYDLKKHRVGKVSYTHAAAGASDYLLQQIGQKEVVVELAKEEEGKQDDELTCVQKAREQWQLSLTEELLCIAKERKESLVVLRNKINQKKKTKPEGREKEDEEGDKEDEEQAPRFLFDSEDLLDAIVSIECNDYMCPIPHDSYWGMIKLEMLSEDGKQQTDLAYLQRLFPEFSCGHRHMGLDDDTSGGSSSRGSSSAAQRYVAQRMALGKKVQRRSFIPIIRQYAKCGIPQGLRPQLWRLMLGLPEKTNDMEKTYFAQLQDHVGHFKLITDDLFEMDVSHMADDHRYFPFEELLNLVVQAFARDPWIREHAAVQVHQPILHYNNIHHQRDRDVQAHVRRDMAIPPSGVLPFRGFINYAAPLCYLYMDPESVYFVMRAFWAHIWCRLNEVGHLLHLCKMFEDLLMRYHPQLFFHLINLHVNPLQLVMPWIQHSFVGFLAVDQVLTLWDRLLGYDDLSLLPLLSCAILVFKSEALMEARDEEMIHKILGDGNRLKIIPLLHAFLFP